MIKNGAGMLAISTLIAALPITAFTTVSARGLPPFGTVTGNESIPETDGMKKIPGRYVRHPVCGICTAEYSGSHRRVSVRQTGTTRGLRTDQTAYYYAAAEQEASAAVWG